MLKFLAFLLLAVPIFSEWDEYSTNFKIRSSTRWDRFACYLLKSMVNGSVVTHSQANQFLQTFSKVFRKMGSRWFLIIKILDLQGTGEFSDYRNATAIGIGDARFQFYKGDRAAADALAGTIKYLFVSHYFCAPECGVIFSIF